MSYPLGHTQSSLLFSEVIMPCSLFSGVACGNLFFANATVFHRPFYHTQETLTNWWLHVVCFIIQFKHVFIYIYQQGIGFGSGVREFTMYITCAIKPIPSRCFVRIDISHDATTVLNYKIKLGHDDMWHSMYKTIPRLIGGVSTVCRTTLGKV